MMDAVTRKRIFLLLKWICYVMLALVFYVLTQTPGMFTLFGIKPVLLVPAAVMLSIFEGELAGALGGAFCGLLMEMGSNRPVGSLSLVMLVLCMLAGLLFIYVIQISWITATIAVGAAALLVGMIDYVMTYLVGGLEQGGVILISTTLPVILYTTVWAPPVYALMKAVSGFFKKRLGDQ